VPIKQKQEDGVSNEAIASVKNGTASSASAIVKKEY
jgi:hypothetical protein